MTHTYKRLCIGSYNLDGTYFQKPHLFTSKRSGYRGICEDCYRQTMHIRDVFMALPAEEQYKMTILWEQRDQKWQADKEASHIHDLEKRIRECL